MCHFITATLPRKVELGLVAPIFESHKLGFKLIANRHIAEQIESGNSYILTTRGQCDCGTVLGSHNNADDHGSVGSDRELKKLRKQGWSEAKIQRWIEQKEQTKVRNVLKEEADAQADLPLAEHWIRFITDLLESGYTSKFGLLLHWYHGGVENERIQIQSTEKVTLTELSPGQLTRMKEDVLYEFVVQ
jgi:hypothetical protein